MPKISCPRESGVLSRRNCPWTKIRPGSIILITFEDGFLSTGSFASVKRKFPWTAVLAKLKQNGYPFCFNFPIFCGEICHHKAPKMAVDKKYKTSFIHGHFGAQKAPKWTADNEFLSIFCGKTTKMVILYICIMLHKIKHVRFLQYLWVFCDRQALPDLTVSLLTLPSVCYLT